jgi:hypothetical protein
MGGPVNARARALVADLRAFLERHPHALAINAHAGAWLQVYITAVDDAAVDTFAGELDLSPPARASHEGVSWYRAALSEHDAAITVISPHREEGPPREAARWGAGRVAPSRHRWPGTATLLRSRR